MSEKYKKVLIAVGITLCVTIVTFAVIFIGYTQNLKNTSDYGLVTTNTINSVVDNYGENTSQTSGTDDLNINEALNQTLNNSHYHYVSQEFDNPLLNSHAENLA